MLGINDGKRRRKLVINKAVNFIQNDAKIVDNFSCLLLLATQESLQNSIGYKVDSLTAEHC